MVAASIAAEGGDLGIVYLVVAVVLVAVFAPVAALIGRDASRHGHNGWAWGLAFICSPVVVGIAYLVVRLRTSRQPAAS